MFRKGIFPRLLSHLLGFVFFMTAAGVLLLWQIHDLNPESWATGVRNLLSPKSLTEFIAAYHPDGKEIALVEEYGIGEDLLAEVSGLELWVDDAFDEGDGDRLLYLTFAREEEEVPLVEAATGMRAIGWKRTRTIEEKKALFLWWNLNHRHDLPELVFRTLRELEFYSQLTGKLEPASTPENFLPKSLRQPVSAFLNLIGLGSEDAKGER